VADETPVLELKGITKRFPGVVANDHVDFDLRRGEVHALLGENGAGKSTLMNILYGLYHADEGEIRLHGKPVTISSPSQAIELGIGMVHQHFMLIPVMTVAENMVLGQEPEKGPFLDEGEAERVTLALAKTLGFAVDAHAKVEDISVGQQQRVEILKAIYRKADILILDEPTAVLTPQEAKELGQIIRNFTSEWRTSIIFITHKLDEVLDFADRITVLRRGKTVATLPREGATEEGLASLMVGRTVLLEVEKREGTPGESLLSVDNLHVLDDRGLEAVKGVTLDVRAGEIVAVAGVDGNGQTELVEAIAGMRNPTSGRIVVAGRELTHASVRDAFDAGLGHIPQDRHRHGLVLDFSLAENLVLHDVSKPPNSRFGWLSPRGLISRAGATLADFDVRGGGPKTHAGALSGGNQQKVIVAREVSRDPRVLLAVQPTRGLDVGAIEYVHRRLVGERDAGRAILLVSLEIEEILSLADRILVMFEGAVVAEFAPGVSAQEVGLAMTGAHREGTVA
jgi:simple sugar transport system ATP-binding protein